MSQPLQQSEWYGNPKGYNITYKRSGTNETLFSIIEDHTANSHVLSNLEEWSVYEIQMTAINEVGTSEESPMATERTREAGEYLLYLFKIFTKFLSTLTAKKQIVSRRRCL